MLRSIASIATKGAIAPKVANPVRHASSLPFGNLIPDDLKSPLPAGYSVPQDLLSMPETKVTTLSNGLRVATEEIPGATATCGMWIDAGSRYETSANNGTAHFLEHLAFKGTQKRSQYQLEKELENMGGHLNAYTSREQTVYYAKTAKEDVAQAVDILSDILRNSNFDQESIDRERGIILREMEEVNSIHEEVVFDFLFNSAFQETSLGYTILGPPENVKKISRDNLVSYINKHYVASKMVFVAAGGVKHEEVVQMAEDKFSWLPKGDTISPPKTWFTGSDVRIRNDDMQSGHIALAFETCGWDHPDATALSVFQSILGAWDTKHFSGDNTLSPMCRDFAQNNTVNSAMAFNTFCSDTGLFGVYLDVPKGNDLEDAVGHALYSMVTPCFKVSERSVERAKNTVKTAMLFQLDGTSAIAENIGTQMLSYGRRVPISEQFARVDAVDAAAIKNVANKYIFDRELAIASYGSLSGLPDINWLRRRTYMNRF